MKRTRFTDEQIIGILAEHDAGAKCAEPSGINRIYRLYREEGLAVRKRSTRRKALGTRAPILVEPRANARWSLDPRHGPRTSGGTMARFTTSLPAGAGSGS